MKSKIAKIQIGKAGITPGMLENITKSFKTRQLVKINILKGYSRDRKKIKSEAEFICRELESKTGKKYRASIIGFTIIIKKK
ncbi:MAG: YhbY family RNA-binding protein [Candidatus Pacearchaeota archaeon]